MALQINRNGGVYHEGKLYSDDKKMQVALKYLELIEEEGRGPCRRLAEAAGVGKTYASTVIREIHDGNVILATDKPPKDIPPRHWGQDVGRRR